MTEDPDDLRWRDAVDADALGEATDDQQTFLATYLPRGRAPRLEHRLLTELRASGARLLATTAIGSTIVRLRPPVGAVRRRPT